MSERSILLPQHERLIADSGIAPEVARARGYRSVSTRSELRRLGFGDNQCRVPALLIPVRSAPGEISTYQIRPDEPRINEDGKPVKYEMPRGSRMVLDVPPVVSHHIGDPSVPLFITEGVRKADSAASRGLCCIALLGVWNWRGTNECGGRVALADWEIIALNGRETYVLFDSDVMTKPEVHRALVRLKGFLESRGARLMVVYLPPGDGGTKVGLDDFLAAGHTVGELLALASPDLRAPAYSEDEADHAPYRETPAGIVWLKPTPNGVAPTLLTNFSARIVADISEDDGVETRRLFEIEAGLNSRQVRFIVPGTQFPSMNWATEHLGAGAVVQPGFGLRDHARAAIQCTSGDVPWRRVYSHTGWRRIEDAWLYLHAGGGIGAEGRAEGVEVRLPEGLAHFELPDPPEGERLQAAVRASLNLLNLAPHVVTFPLFAAVWSVVLQPSDFSLHVTGPTGCCKTELVALPQQHWGPGLDARHLPGSWSSTGNAMEAVAFVAKDALLVVDDFAPSGSAADVARAHREADRLLRGQGNRAGRQRMRADASLAPHKPPRGLIVSTGEDVPRGQSLRSRMLVLELSPGAVNFTELTLCQRDAARGLYAQALSGFVRYIAARYDAVRESVQAETEALRERAHHSVQHRRTSDIVAKLGVGLRYFLNFAQGAGAMGHEAADALWESGWKALGNAAAAQSSHQAGAEPVGRFLELLVAAIANGTAHVASRDGAEPDTPEAWGWQLSTVGAGDNARDEWRPMGARVGWLDGEDLYLESEAAFAAAQSVARDTGDSLAVTSRILHKRMHEQGLLASTEQEHGALAVRRTLQGTRRNVLHLRADRLVCPRTAQPAQRAQLPTREGTERHAPGRLSAREDGEPAPRDRQDLRPGEGAGDEMGAKGSLGGFPDALAEAEARIRECYTCGGTRYWRDALGGVGCATCHPPASEALVVEWLEVGDTAQCAPMLGGDTRSRTLPIG
jgi:hypothetical protein